MAEINQEAVNATTEQDTQTTNQTETADSVEAKEVSQDEVNSLRVELAKMKRLSDKNASEAAEWKKKYRSTQSEKEVLDAEKAEQQAQRDAELADLKRYKLVSEYKDSYLQNGYPIDLAKQAAEALADNDNEMLFKIENQVFESRLKAEKAEWMKSMPDANIGNGSSASVTKEQFDSMSLQERTKIYREDPETYNRLVGKK